MPPRQPRCIPAPGPWALTPLLLLCAAGPAAEPDPNDLPNPFPREVNRSVRLAEWTFPAVPDGWRAVHDCSLTAADGRLVITCTGTDPYIHIPATAPPGQILLRLRARCRTGGMGQFFYVTDRSPSWSERQSRRFVLHHDGKWHDYEVRLNTTGRLTHLRLDPGSAAGRVEIERLTLHRMELHPLEIVALRQGEREIAVAVRNHDDRPRTARLADSRAEIAPGATARLTRPYRPARPFEQVTVMVTSPGLSDLRRTVWRCNRSVPARWVSLRAGRVGLRVAPDGAGAWVDLDGEAAAAISPIAAPESAAGPVALTVRLEGKRVLLGGEGISASLAVREGQVAFRLDANRPCVAPAIRVVGALEQGLFPGLEYLGRGEHSSSKKDIETPDHLRFAPDPLKVTMPLMAVRTDRALVALAWEDMSLRPVFASPNFLDGTGRRHLVALKGRAVTAVLRVAPPAPVEDAVAWAVARRGLPPLPRPSRTPREQRELALRALSGAVAGPGGWGHCAEARWPRRPYADVASTIWRLTGRAPKLDNVVPGGAHVRNDAIYFVTGRAEQWLRMRRNQARNIARSQRADGSFRYAGKYRRGHFEDTASGFCARPAYELLEFARLTGDAEAQAAGLRALEYMKRFRTPRGAQTWELSLHTPDILASAYLVAAYVRGFELTGRNEYLALARRWALSGVPFVYQWARYPVMVYATVPVYGATNWRAPNWMGLPVQWCGGVYAYFLTELAKYDRAGPDWRRLAEGILLAGEQMQYPGGPLAGCLPDVFHLAAQQRSGPSINPCALMSLRLAVEGKPAGLAAAAGGGHRLCAPWPVSIRGGKARVSARAGTAYQVVIDGRRIVNVAASAGEDTIPLD